MLTGSTAEERIWNYLKDKGFNDYTIAGIMGNIYAESGLRSNNVQNSYESSVGTDVVYTTKVNNGSYSRTDFSEDQAGYGLCQWTYWSRKQALYDLVKSKGVSIADEEAQLDFLMKEITASKLISTLRECTSVYDASTAFMLGFEKPKDQSDKAKERRAGYGQVYYDKYASKTTTTTSYTLDQNLAVLKEYGVMNTTEYWKEKTNSVQYLDILISNMADTIRRLTNND